MFPIVLLWSVLWLDYVVVSVLGVSMALKSNLWSCSELGAGMDAAAMTATVVKQEMEPEPTSIDSVNAEIMVFYSFIEAAHYCRA